MNGIVFRTVYMSANQVLFHAVKPLSLKSPTIILIECEGISCVNWCAKLYFCLRRVSRVRSVKIYYIYWYWGWVYFHGHDPGIEKFDVNLRAFEKNILHRNKTPNFSVLLLIMVILSLFASTSVICFFRSLWFSASSCMSVSFRCSSSILLEK